MASGRLGRACTVKGREEGGMCGRFDVYRSLASGSIRPMFILSTK